MSGQERPTRPMRSGYTQFVPISTRWIDNDVYGHINNAVYYSFFDTAVNQMLVEAHVLNPISDNIVGLVVDTRCTYFGSVSFPDSLEVGIRVEHIGRTSVRYDLAVFKVGDELADARGAFTHVYVSRATQTPVPIPLDVMAVLKKLHT